MPVDRIFGSKSISNRPSTKIHFPKLQKVKSVENSLKLEDEQTDIIFGSKPPSELHLYIPRFVEILKEHCLLSLCSFVKTFAGFFSLFNFLF